jgi:ABC-type phosphate/phosphonate transport system substrate-binding protein
MKKRIISICLSLAMAALIAGCGSSEKTISGEVVNVTTDSEEETTEDATQAEENDVQEEAGQGYVFTVKGTTFVVDGEAADAVEALGDPLSYYESPSCAFGDLDKIYTYNGFELDTYSTGGKDYVSAIILKDDSLSTPEGVCIGDTEDKVRETYGTPDSEADSTLLYTKDGMKLSFIIQEGKVASVQYLSTVLD